MMRFTAPEVRLASPVTGGDAPLAAAAAEIVRSGSRENDLNTSAESILQESLSTEYVSAGRGLS